MTQTLGLNGAHDIYVGTNGNIVVATGQEAVLEACETAAYAQLGEEVLSTTSGIPNFQAVWVGVPNVAIFEAYLRTALLNVQGVTAIESLTTTVQNGTLSYIAVIENQFGNSVTLAGEMPFG